MNATRDIPATPIKLHKTTKVDLLKPSGGKSASSAGWESWFFLLLRIGIFVSAVLFIIEKSPQFGHLNPRPTEDSGAASFLPHTQEKIIRLPLALGSLSAIFLQMLSRS